MINRTNFLSPHPLIYLVGQFLRDFLPDQFHFGLLAPCMHSCTGAKEKVILSNIFLGSANHDDNTYSLLKYHFRMYVWPVLHT